MADAQVERIAFENGRMVRSPVLVLVHVVWAVRQRRPFLPPSLDARLCDLLGRKAGDAGSHVLAAGCASDHVHVVVRLDPNAPLSEVIRRMKGGSAYELKHEGALPERFAWQHRYWAQSLAPEDLRAVAQYVQRQREHHSRPQASEPWTISEP